MAFPLLLAGLAGGGGGGGGGHGGAGPSEATNTGTFGDTKDIFAPVNIGGFKSDGSAGAVFPKWAVYGAIALAALFIWKKFGK